MDNILASILDGVPDVVLESGHSGYFSAPQKTLDPALFKGDHIKADVRFDLLNTLYKFLAFRGYDWAPRWSTAWLAGSGISYQWAGDRGNGDLDVLIGVDSTEFKQLNPQFSTWGEVDIDDMLTAELRAELWPRTANTVINGKTFEVTYFVNHRASDIRAIHPYAAYDLTHDEWTIRPPELPDDPRTLYPRDWFDAAQRDADTVDSLARRFNQSKNSSSGRDGGKVTPALLPALLAAATRMFDEIHTGRSAAFSSMGEGYGDWNNFRWQSAKNSGVIGALSQIVKVGDDWKASEDQRLYGGPIGSSEEALRAAMEAVSRG